MVLGCLVGLVVGCLMSVFNFLLWRSVGTKKSINAYVNAYWGTLLIVLLSVILGALTGVLSGW